MAPPGPCTLAHLQRVMASVAAATAIGAACSYLPASRPEGSTPPEPPELPTGDPLEVLKPGQDLPDPLGYMVIDMLPPPALCSGVAQQTGAKAHWQRDDQGWYLQVELAKPAFGALDPSGSIRAVTGRVTAQTTASGGMTLQWRPNDDAPRATTLFVPAFANSVSQLVGLSFDVEPSVSRVENRAVAVMAFDTCR